MRIGLYVLIIYFFSISVSQSMPAAQLRDFSPVPFSVATIEEALLYLRRIVSAIGVKDISDPKFDDAKKAHLLIQCAKILYDQAFAQILDALQEIDRRIFYWRYQKYHQWQYFFTKSPIKWFTGKSQEAEVEEKLERLESYQGELYALLGSLKRHGLIFEQKYKTDFMSDYKKGYEWIDELLSLLSRIKITQQMTKKGSVFFERATQLKLKLEKVHNFKNDLLSEMIDTQIPVSLERNWLKYGALVMALAQGYGRIDQLKNFFQSAKTNLDFYIATPVQNVIKDVFMPGYEQGSFELGQEADGRLMQSPSEVTLSSIGEFIEKTSKKYEIDEERYGLKKDAMIKDLKEGNYNTFQEFLNVIADKEGFDSSRQSSLSPQLYQQAKGLLVKVSGLSDFIRGTLYLNQLFGQSRVDALQKQFKGVGQLVLLTPAALAAWLAYSGYQRLREKDYSALRRGLADVNSLLIDITKDLSTERYGKMLYLLYDLKKRASKELATKGFVQHDFIEDLERIESDEFDVAAKRSIIDNMFKKYSFLGLVQKK